MLWVHGMISMGTWKYFLGSIEKFQRAIGYVVARVSKQGSSG
jgi:hypothetical protein